MYLKGVPSYPDYSLFWEIIEKHKVTQFYTANRYRALAKEIIETFRKLKSIKSNWICGEPINERLGIGIMTTLEIDVQWWTLGGKQKQAELLICQFHLLRQQTYATLPLPGIQPVLMDENVNRGQSGGWFYALNFLSWNHGTIWGDHQDIKRPIFLPFQANILWRWRFA
jgi:acetyl-CoA synthetase